MFELKKYGVEIVDIASNWLGIEYPIISALTETTKMLMDIPSRIIMHKLCWVLSKQDADFDEWLKLSEYFEKDVENYNTIVRQLILCINALNEEPLLDIYANLLRSWHNGFIDKQKFLRLSWTLPNIYSEDLFCLKDIYNKTDIKQSGSLVAIHNIGLVDARINTYPGNCPTVYNINSLGMDMLQYGLDYENYQLYQRCREDIKSK